jgi:formylglycine-generating enzyme required for sulfatase activity
VLKRYWLGKTKIFFTVIGVTDNTAEKIMKIFFFTLTLWLSIVSLVSPLVAQSVSKLELEKSSALNAWQKVTITPDMISSTGELLLPTSGTQQFYRMKMSIVQVPTISSPPPATTGIEEGESVTFTVVAQGEGLTYQWYLGQSGDTSQAIQGATSQTYNTGSLSADTSYWVKVTNDAGSINSETVAVTINRPPTITSQPTSQSIYSGYTATLTVSSTGSAPFTYQWYRGNLGATTAPVGTNSPSFTTPDLTQTTKYWVKITNAFGEIQSNSITVTVIAAPSGMALIPQGAFTMGDALDGASDAPTHTVNVSAFYMAQNLVTKAQWDTVRTWAISNGYSDLAVGEGKASNHPVQTISWFQMVKWCNARSQQEGLTPVYYTNDTQTTVYKTGDVNVTNLQVKWTANGYRLPTEAEWEKAARGGLSGKRFPWGDTISQTQANYYASSDYSYAYDLSSEVNNYHPTYATGAEAYTSPVGDFAANGYGLYDMAGNVLQWCWDWYGTYNTGTPTDPRGVISGTSRVLRGGGWTSDASNCRTADRFYFGASHTFSGFGFRVARSLVP